jgi:hypothetical protein
VAVVVVLLDLFASAVDEIVERRNGDLAVVHDAGIQYRNDDVMANVRFVSQTERRQQRVFGKRAETVGAGMHGCIDGDGEYVIALGQDVQSPHRHFHGDRIDRFVLVDDRARSSDGGLHLLVRALARGDDHAYRVVRRPQAIDLLEITIQFFVTGTIGSSPPRCRGVCASNARRNQNEDECRKRSLSQRELS